FGNRKIGPGIRAEPARVDGNGFADDAHHFLGIVLVLGKGEDMEMDATDLAGDFLVAVAAQQRKVADAVGLDDQFLPMLTYLCGGQNGAGAGDFLIARQRETNVIDAGFVEEWLVPRDEWRRLPA